MLISFIALLLIGLRPRLFLDLAVVNFLPTLHWSCQATSRQEVTARGQEIVPSMTPYKTTTCCFTQWVVLPMTNKQTFICKTGEVPLKPRGVQEMLRWKRQITTQSKVNVESEDTNVLKWNEHIMDQPKEMTFLAAHIQPGQLFAPESHGLEREEVRIRTQAQQKGTSCYCTEGMSGLSHHSTCVSVVISRMFSAMYCAVVQLVVSHFTLGCVENNTSA